MKAQAWKYWEKKVLIFYIWIFFYQLLYEFFNLFNKAGWVKTFKFSPIFFQDAKAWESIMKEKFQCEITERKGDHKVRKRRRNMEIKLCPALIKSLKFAAPLNSLNFMDAIACARAFAV